MMERKAFKEVDKECPGSYIISASTPKRVSGVQLSKHTRTFETTSTNTDSNIGGSSPLETNIMQTSTTSIPPVATISPRIKMRYVFKIIIAV